MGITAAEVLEPATGFRPVLGRALTWAGVAAVAAPVAIVLHELGHYVVGLLFGFPDLALHYGSVTHGAREAGFPRWQLGLQTAAGPVVTLAIVGACCVVTRRRGGGALTVAPALAAGVRTVAIGMGYFTVRLLNRGGEVNPNFDEYNVAVALDVAPDLVVAVSFLAIVVGWVYLIGSISRGSRAVALVGAAIGTLAGLVAYIAVIGPAVLP